MRGNINYLIVASISGRTAIRFAEKAGKAKVVCVPGPPQWDCEMGGGRWPYIPEDVRARLEELGVQIVDRAPTTSREALLTTA